MATTLRKSILMLIVLTGFGFALYTGPILAMDLQEAKAQGLVGEKSNGYLGVVKSAPGVSELVQRINDARRQHYQEIASRNGTSVDVVEQLAGKKAIEKTPAGQYIQLPPGSWVSK